MPLSFPPPAELGNALVQFEKDYMGRGPQETKAYIIEDMILLRLKGVLTPAEQKLAHTTKGRELIKNIRSSLLEEGRELLSQSVAHLTKATTGRDPLFSLDSPC